MRMNTIAVAYSLELPVVRILGNATDWVYSLPTITVTKY